MWRGLLVLLMIEQNGLAVPPLPVEHPWADAVAAAKPAIAACVRDAEAQHLIGDVTVAHQFEKKTWTTTAAKSLGARGPKIAACVRAAVEKKYVVHVERYVDSFERFRDSSETVKIGDPTNVIPPPTTLLPAWRAAIASTATKAERDAFAKLLPVDYKLDGGCLVAQRPYLTDVEQKWLDRAGARTSYAWHDALAKLGPTKPWSAVWTGRELVTTGAGLCLAALDATADAVLQPAFASAGTCWVGTTADILTRPRIEFPHDRTFMQVATDYGRTCAVATTGDVTCCGAVYPKLAPPPSHVVQIAIGVDFTCGLDSAGAATCTGSIATAPRGAFRKLNATQDHVCGLHHDGSIECWNAQGPLEGLPGKYIDVATDQQTCGIRTDGRLACAKGDAPPVQAPGTYAALAGEFGVACALRKDGRLACIENYELGRTSTVFTLTNESWLDLAVSGGSACGRRADRTIACVDLHPIGRGAAAPMVAPPGPFLQIAGDMGQFCGITVAGQVACWGQEFMHDTVQPQPGPDAHGTIVDEKGAAIARAEVMICEQQNGACSALAWRGRTEPGSLTALSTTLTDPKGWTIATTAADGTWHVPTQGYQLTALITAPGRELRELDIQDRNQLVGPLVLRPATTLDIAATCDGRPCTTPKLTVTARLWDGAHLEHVAPGTYHVVAWNDFETKYEKAAAIDVEVPFAVVPQTIKLALRDTGTHHDVRGKLVIDGEKVEGMGVSVRCAEGVGREARVDAKGDFVVENIGALPCRVDGGGGSMELQHYADPIVIKGHVIRVHHR